MHTLFYPRSIAVVGVSEAPSNLGRNIVGNLDRFSFAGEVYPVGKNGGRLGERIIYRSLTDIPAVPESAVLLIPAERVPAAVEECGRKGIRWVIVESGGFSEYAESQARAEAELLAIARKYGIRLVGPNCISITNLENGMVLPFVALDPETAQKEAISLISQSGGVVFALWKKFSLESLGFNKFISVGNKLDLNENDYLEYLLQDEDSKVVGLYLESVSDGRRLMQLAQAADKPIVALKANIHPVTHKAARFHTAALAGDDEVCQAALAQAGIHRVRTFSELMDHFRIFLLPLMAGPNLAILGRSGGQNVMAADEAAAYGFKLPPFSQKLLRKVQSHLRAGVIRLTNPLDLGDVFDLEFYIDIVETALKDPRFDGVFFRHAYTTLVGMSGTKKFLQAAQELSLRHAKPVMVCLLTDSKEREKIKVPQGYPLFAENQPALQALAASRRQAEKNARRRTRPFITSLPAAHYQTDSAAALPAAEAFSLLTAWGLRVAEFKPVRNLKEALAAGAQLKYPVALKIASAQVLHKTEAKAVVTGLAGPAALKAAFTEMQKSLSAVLPAKELLFLVQRMVPAGIEMIVGAKRDSEFGPVVVCGLGGMLVEVFKDVALRVAPVSQGQALDMIKQTKAHALLAGFRGRHAGDVKALARLVSAFSRIMAQNPEVKEIEANPVMVLPPGQGCVIVDARMRVQGD